MWGDGEKTMNYAEILEKAHAAGRAAAQATKPVPMYVQAGDLMGNGYGPIEKVDDGVCGFAWIKFPGNKPFGRWAKKAGLARSAYPTGLCISISAYNQSMQLKEAHARAAVAVLKEHGIECYVDSRMD
jgi:hypothetical protein